MSADWVQTAPVILSDAMFFENVPYCRATGTATNRQAAYLAAEHQMVREIGSPLTPTVMTGTYLWPYPYKPIVLDYRRVSTINGIVAKTLNEACTCTLDEDEACAILRDPKHGVVDIRLITNVLTRACGCGPGAAYQAEIAFTAGLPTGVSALDSELHLALSMAALLTLNEIVDPGANEGGPGDPGVQSWAGGGYSEQRTHLDWTPFGTSARANKIRTLVNHLRVRKPMRFPP